MGSPFTPTAVPSVGLIDRLLKRPQYDAAVTALGNVLAAEPPTALTSDRVHDMLRPYHVAAPDGLATVAYRLVFRACVGLIARGGMSQPDDAYVADLAHALSLPADRARAARDEAVRIAVSERAKHILAAHRISPRDEAQFKEWASALDAGIQLSDFVASDTLDMYRQMWAAENGELPSVLVDIHLQRGEVCHAVLPVSWAEHRAVTTRVHYSGYVSSVRIMKGVRYRAGTYRPVRETQDVLATLDSGMLYITSKRVIFQGATLNKTITYSSLLGIIPYSDGVELEKSSGKPPVLLTSDAEYVAVMISTALGLS